MRVLLQTARLFLVSGVLFAYPDEVSSPHDLAEVSAVESPSEVIQTEELVAAQAAEAVVTPDPSTLLLLEQAEKYLENPALISGGCAPCYPGRPCPPPWAPRKQIPKPSFYFDFPEEKGQSSGTYIFGEPTNRSDPTSNAPKNQSFPVGIQGNQSSNSTPLPQAAPPKQKTGPSPYDFPEHSTVTGSLKQTEGDGSIGDDEDHPHYAIGQCNPGGEGFTLNFENIAVVELLQFISRISGVNFIFDAADLQFNITIVSQEAASVPELTSSLLQILKMHGLSFVEQGNTVLIYRENSLSRVSKVITEENIQDACDAAVITRVFRLYNVDPEKIAVIVKPLVSADAIVEVSKETRHLIVSDITYNVDKIAQLLNALDTPNTMFEVAEYHVKGGYPTALVAYAKEILAPLLVDNPMQMIAQPSSSKIFLVSTPYLIHKALQLLSSLDSADVTDVSDLPPTSIANNTMFMYKLKYHPGKDIAEAIRQIGSNLQYTGVANLELVNAAYSTQFLEVNNSVVVTGSQDAVGKVVTLLNNLDQPPKQVYLEVLIIDTTLINSLDFGVQWIGLGDEQDKLAYATGLLSNINTGGPDLQGVYTTPPGARYVSASGTPPPRIPNPGRDVSLPTPDELQGFPSLSDFSEAFGFGIIGNIISHNGHSFLTLGALVSALEEEQSTKLVLNPRIMALDTQPADIFVGQNIPYQTTSSVIQQTGSVTQNIQYEDVGIHLRITPTISPNNNVSMDIEQTISETVSAVGTLTPTTTKTLTTTRLHVPDGCFLVMSGHIRDNTTTIHSGVPCLGSLPLIGPTFSRTVDQREKRNLIMFIRPKVITNIAQELELTNQEGYDYNWETCPDALLECGAKDAPECEVYPPYKCPPN